MTEPSADAAAVRSEIAPTGTLRVGLNMSNFLLTRKEYRTNTVTPEQVNEVLLVARWFRMKPAELNRTTRV